MTARAQSLLDTVDTVPYEFYEQVRRQGDVVWDQGLNAWLVVSDALVRTVAMDDSLFVHAYSTLRAASLYKKLRGENNPRSTFFMVGEEHRAVHRWWLSELLSPRQIEEYRISAIEPTIDRIVSGLRARDGFDVADDFAERIPVAIFAALCGLPGDPEFLANIKKLQASYGKFTSLANSFKLEGTPSEADQAIVDDAIACSEKLSQLLQPFVQERESGTGSDLISRLWSGGRKLYADWNYIDALDACRRLLFAGTDTTTHSICNAYYMLLTDAELMKSVREGDAEDTRNFVEEALRLNGTTHFRPRRASADTQLGGVKIAKGDLIVTIMLAANRDPGKYQCPHLADLHRKTPRGHLSFFFGPRSCPGANLARAELVAAVSRGLSGFPKMRLTGTVKPAMHGYLLRSYRPLAVSIV